MSIENYVLPVMWDSFNCFLAMYTSFIFFMTSEKSDYFNVVPAKFNEA